MYTCQQPKQPHNHLWSPQDALAQIRSSIFFNFNEMGRFRKIEGLSQAVTDTINQVTSFEEVAALYGVDTGSQCWQILQEQGPPRCAVSDELLQRIQEWSLPSDYIPEKESTLTTPAAAPDREAAASAASVLEEEGGKWGKALKAAASAAKASSDASSSVGGHSGMAKPVSPASVGGSQKKSSSESRGSKPLSEEVMYGTEEAEHPPSPRPDAADRSRSPSRGRDTVSIRSDSEFSISDPSQSHAKMLHDQMAMLMQRQEQMEQRELALKRKQAEMEENHAKALEKIREEVDDVVRGAFERSAEDTAKELNRRRHTGSASSAWGDKKKARAEAHAARVAAGTAASSSSSTAIPPGYCVTCAKNHAGLQCCRQMCRPCCLKTFLIEKRTNEQCPKCPQHQEQQ